MKLTSLLKWNDYHNLPKKFIERAMFEGTVIDSNYSLRGEREVNFIKNYKYTRYAPWTTHAKLINRQYIKDRKPNFVMPVKNWFYFRGDKVEILSGKDKGKQGNVCAIIRERNWVFVKDLNCKFKKTGGVNGYPVICVKEEQPLLITKDVRLVDPFDNHPCEVEWRYTEAGDKVRVSKRTERIIPIPKQAEETIDYKTKESYQRKCYVSNNN
ncbi:hypothetical protein GJ496_007361 [Pomphorhynchus laevis]|nr:hypothetical protein GJ496_007361 [Pomphorhynchus laevis]